jgi:hypothetical protein
MDERWRARLSDPVWQGIGVLISVAGLAIAAISIINADDGSESRSDGGRPSTSADEHSTIEPTSVPTEPLISYEVVLYLQQNAAGTEVGSYEFPEYDCAGILRLESVDRNTITVSGYVIDQTEVESRSCDDGIKAISLLDANHVFFSYESNGRGEGTLERVQ